LLINGDFQVSQRGDFTSASSATNGEYFVDRWYADINTTINKQQTTGIDLDGTPAITKGVKLTATASASAYIGVRQKIENPTQYVGRTFTYSGYVRSNNPNARLTSFIADTAGTTNQVVSSNAHSGNGQWEKLSVTFIMTSNATSAWFVSAFISSSAVGNVSISSGDYIEVTMLQMEINKTFTPFEHRSYGEELALCQRYYYKIDSALNNAPYQRYAVVSIETSTNAEAFFSHPVTMRTSPTLEASAAANFHIFAANTATVLSVNMSIDQSSPSTTGLVLAVASGLTAGQVGLLNSNNNNTSYIAFNAEL